MKKLKLCWEEIWISFCVIFQIDCHHQFQQWNSKNLFLDFIVFANNFNMLFIFLVILNCVPNLTLQKVVSCFIFYYPWSELHWGQNPKIKDEYPKNNSLQQHLWCFSSNNVGHMHINWKEERWNSHRQFCWNQNQTSFSQHLCVHELWCITLKYLTPFATKHIQSNSPTSSIISSFPIELEGGEYISLHTTSLWCDLESILVLQKQFQGKKEV
jgi:hypothetical protein